MQKNTRTPVRITTTHLLEFPDIRPVTITIIHEFDDKSGSRRQTMIYPNDPQFLDEEILPVIEKIAQEEFAEDMRSAYTRIIALVSES